MKKTGKAVNIAFIILFILLGSISMYAILFENKIYHSALVIIDAIMIVINYIDLITKE